MDSENNSNYLQWLEANDDQSIYQVATLHKKLLTESPIPKFGFYFMTRFYYKKLIRAKLIRCLIYKKDLKVVGFIVVTEFPEKFMIDGFIKYFSKTMQ